MDKIEIVNTLWETFSKADYRSTESILHCDLKVVWPTSREFYDSREMFIAVNEAFGDGWRFDVQVIEETLSDRVISVVFVSSPDCNDSFFATSIFDFENGVIINIETYWAFKDKQPEWRKALSTVY
ncbi:hypothetical protein [Psychromonas sp. Urea-02u-13]|uniref:hypothetical protein n=1 Tax=Psychromonas sp. Urea-02u-13 TaxID=2058326 RepID=UPI000C31C20F|nr:hypothetical protein [Psychromonas sp. Urea-02u-13]PKG37844.1 hypothetical protein CXF74_16600 [Psychromonas sp. Urea-02u-13]